jgi:hypothetical protein
MKMEVEFNLRAFVDGEYCDIDCPFFDSRSSDDHKCRLFGGLRNGRHHPDKWERAYVCKNLGSTRGYHAR